MTEITITKLDAARRQLKTAIELYFSDGDPVAIHTLVFAAHEIIDNLLKATGRKSRMFRPSSVRKDKRQTWAQILKRDANFFKHANNDLKSSIKFHPFSNDFFFVHALSALDEIGEPRSMEGLAMSFWLRLRHPDLYTEEYPRSAYPINILDRITERPQFFAMFQVFWKMGEFRSLAPGP